jgi:transposase
MHHFTHYIGIDIAADHVTISILTSPTASVVLGKDVENSPDGFAEFFALLDAHHITPASSVCCLEATGVYGEHLCYILQAHGYKVAVEPPLKVKRAFALSGHKSDAVDSRQIAEYAYRFADELNFWTPRSTILEQIQVLLTAREQFTQQKVANQTTLKALERKYVQTPLANSRYILTIEQLNENIKAIDKELKNLIKGDSSFRQMLTALTSIPGVGILLATRLMVVTENFTRPVTARQLSAFIGICPYMHESGSSISKPPRSRRHGPAALRKLLYLAAMSVRQHSAPFKHYFLRKVAEGKSPRLVINNIANKLLKIICAVAATRSTYNPKHRSINPVLLLNA